MSYNVINDSSDYTIQSESNVKLEHGIELLTYTPVSGKNYHNDSPFRLLDKVKGELRAMIDIFLCYSSAHFFGLWSFIKL